jgi:hypothetical protein
LIYKLFKKSDKKWNQQMTDAKNTDCIYIEQVLAGRVN